MVASAVPLRPFDERVVLGRDVGQHREAAVVDHGAQQVLRRRAEGGSALAARAGDELVDLLGAHLRVVGELAQARMRGDVGEALDLFGDGGAHRPRRRP